MKHQKRPKLTPQEINQKNLAYYRELVAFHAYYRLGTNELRLANSAVAFYEELCAKEK